MTDSLASGLSIEGGRLLEMQMGVNDWDKFWDLKKRPFKDGVRLNLSQRTFRWRNMLPSSALDENHNFEAEIELHYLLSAESNIICGAFALAKDSF